MRHFRTALFVLLAATASSLSAQSTASVAIDAAADRKAISPLIYGLAYASTSQLSDLNCPLNRSGGNSTTRYNWQANASNRAQDWYFESIGEASATAGESGDTFIADSRGGGAEPMLTIPMIGWVAKLGTNRSKLASYSIARYGAQTGNDWQWFADAGNGISSATGQKITSNDPNEANLPADSAFQGAWMQHLVTKWGTAGSGGLRYYILDNEPSIWQETHRDVHPIGPTMDEIRDRIIDYANRVKATDPNAVVAAPEEWGWSGYLYSGYDQQYGAAHNWSSFPDRINHGGADYLPWLLGQLRQNEASTGKRLLDIFTVHYYPQGGEFGNDTSSAMQLRRNRSTRSLWDPNYVDETWISDKVRLIPRLREWVSLYYPGTRVGVTEYNWGAEGHINGATAQADVLGIFGREGLDVGARWTTPDSTSPTYKSIKLYRNYDGQRSTFGDTSVRAATLNPDALSAFAAVRSSDGAMTVMVVSKVLSGTTSTTITLSNFQASTTAQAWQLTSANTIARLPDLAITGNSLSPSLPPQSVTLFVIPASSGNPAAAPTATVSGGGAICSGGSIAITTILTGTPPWSLTWSDGLQQSGIALSPFLRVASPSVSTNYSLTAVTDSTSPGTTTGSASITVRTPPLITQQPLSRVVRKRKTVTLSVTVSGSTPLSFQWFEGLSGDTSRPVGTNAATYTTPPLSVSISYWVRVSNSCGLVNSTAAALSVR